MALGNWLAIDGFGRGLPVEGTVVAVAAPSWIRPSFAIPLVTFGHGSNALYVQVVDTDDRIISVSPLDVPDEALLLLKEAVGGVRPAAASIHAFIDADGGTIAGTRTELAPIVADWLPRITWPLSRLSFADFVGDERAVVEAADAALKAKSEQRGRHEASVWFANAVVFRRIQRGAIRTATSPGRLADLEQALDQVTLQVTETDLIVHLPSVLMELFDGANARTAPALAMASKLAMLLTPSGLSLRPSDVQPATRRRGDPRGHSSKVRKPLSPEARARKEAADAMRELAAERISTRLGVQMKRLRGSAYESADGSVRAVISTSRRHDRPYQNYWYGFYDAQRAYLGGDSSNYLVLGAVDSGRIWALPASLADPLLDKMSATTRPNGQAYRHIITKLVEDRCFLVAGSQTLDLSSFEV